MLAQRLYVRGLTRGARSDPALAGAETRVLLPETEAPVRNLGLRQSQGRLDDRNINILTLLSRS